MPKMILYTDGASRGNPGPAAIGIVIEDESGRVLRKVGRAIGRATNNQAEYRALILGLEEAARLGVSQLEARSDSELMVRQLNGRYRVRNAALQPLFKRASELLRRLPSATVKYIPREANQKADALVNSVLDGR
jgi:ribonuclease HI